MTKTKEQKGLPENVLNFEFGYIFKNFKTI
jgi:hypothetical protein